MAYLRKGTAFYPSTVTSGTLGSGVVFNDSHKDIDVDADSWTIVQAASAQYTSNTIIAFGYTSHMGSNCSVSSGVIEVGKAGWYYIICTAGHQAFYDQSMQLWRQISDPGDVAGNSTMVTQTGRIYTGDTEKGNSYWGASMTWYAYLRATDHCQIYGIGYLYGNTASDGELVNAMTKFSGVRLGA